MIYCNSSDRSLNCYDILTIVAAEGIEMEFYSEFKTRGADFGGGFTNGMTMTGNSAVVNCRKTFEDEDRTVFAGEGGRIECFHIKRGDVTECCSKYYNDGDSAVTLEMLSSYALKNIHGDVIHRAASFWSAEGRLISQRLVDMNMEPA